MKTIAITIDPPTLERLDELAAAVNGRNRSALVRRALVEFIDRESARLFEAQERKILRKHRKRLAKQAKALVAEQGRR